MDEFSLSPDDHKAIADALDKVRTKPDEPEKKEEAA